MTNSPHIPHKPHRTAIVSASDGCFRALFDVHVISGGRERKVASELWLRDAFKLANELADRIVLEGASHDFPF